MSTLVCAELDFVSSPGWLLPLNTPPPNRSRELGDPQNQVCFSGGVCRGDQRMLNRRYLLKEPTSPSWKWKFCVGVSGRCNCWSFPSGTLEFFSRDSKIGWLVGLFSNRWLAVYRRLFPRPSEMVPSLLFSDGIFSRDVPWSYIVFLTSKSWCSKLCFLLSNNPGISSLQPSSMCGCS